LEEGQSDKVFLAEGSLTTFRLNQISDLHFSAIVGRFNKLEAAHTLRAQADVILSDLLKYGGALSSVLYPSTFSADVALSLLRQLAKEIDRSDALVVTGDLATTGADVDLRIAKGFFSGDIPTNWNPCADISYPSLLSDDSVVVTLPGNHDRYEGAALMPGGVSYERHFGPMWDFQKNQSYDILSLEGKSRVKVCTLEKEKIGLGIVLADFSLDSANSGDGFKGWLGQGAASSVDDLIAATNLIRSEAREVDVGVAVIWAIHFPPSFPNVDENLKLLYENELLAAAEKLGIPLILAGHTHKALRYISGMQKSITVICCGASAGVSVHDEYAYAEIEIDINKNGEIFDIRSVHARWDNDELMFVKQKPYPSHP
jgi:3',5'-cyclic AMP phosphodiesterase CpdA